MSVLGIGQLRRPTGNWLREVGDGGKDECCSPTGSGAVPDGKGCTAGATGGVATFPRASTTVCTTGALLEWLFEELCWSLDNRDITIWPLTWSESLGLAFVRSNRWSKKQRDFSYVNHQRLLATTYTQCPWDVESRLTWFWHIQGNHHLLSYVSSCGSIH